MGIRKLLVFAFEECHNQNRTKNIQARLTSLQRLMAFFAALLQITRCLLQLQINANLLFQNAVAVCSLTPETEDFAVRCKCCSLPAICDDVCADLLFIQSDPSSPGRVRGGERGSLSCQCGEDATKPQPLKTFVNLQHHCVSGRKCILHLIGQTREWLLL